MNKSIMIILVMSVVVFGTIGLMASGAGRANTDSNDINNGAGSGTPLPNPAPSGNGGVQVVSVRALPSGYDKPQITVKAGAPVEFHFSADPNSGCGRQFILDGFGVNLVSRNGEEQVATFTPNAPGKYNYHCGMNMFVGRLTVV